jgi:hypothetical protein
LCPEPLAVRYLGLVLDPEFLYPQYLHTVANKTAGFLCNIFPFPVRDSTLTQSKKLSLYKLLFRSILTYAAPVPPTASTPSYPVIVSPSYRYHLRSTLTSHLRDTVNIEPIQLSSTELQLTFLVTTLPTPSPWPNKSGIVL